MAITVTARKMIGVAMRRPQSWVSWLPRSGERYSVRISRQAPPRVGCSVRFPPAAAAAAGNLRVRSTPPTQGDELITEHKKTCATAPASSIAAGCPSRIGVEADSY